MGSLVENSDILMVSPLTLKPAVLRGMDREMLLARAGAPAELIFKLNSLNDIDIIHKLIEASDAGSKNPHADPRHLLPECRRNGKDAQY